MNRYAIYTPEIGKKQTMRISNDLALSLSRVINSSFFPLAINQPHVFQFPLNRLKCVCVYVCSQFSGYTAPAIRVVDEQGNEIHDRYYKIGSTIDLTCQVATTFITKNATNTPGSQFSLLTPAAPVSTTLFPPVINAFSMLENEIDVTERQSSPPTNINSSLFERIRWTKDGESITKDAFFNRRYVEQSDIWSTI